MQSDGFDKFATTADKPLWSLVFLVFLSKPTVTVVQWNFAENHVEIPMEDSRDNSSIVLACTFHIPYRY